MYEIIENFSRGMWSGGAITDLPDGSLTLMRNCRVKQGQYIGSRLGFKKYSRDKIIINNITYAITGIHEYSYGTTKRLIVTAGDKIYTYDPDTGVFTDSGVSITAGYKQHFTNFYDSVVISNGVDTPIAYDGSSFSNVSINGSMSNFTFSSPYSGNLFVNDPDRPDRIWFCDDYDINTWPITNYLLAPFSKYDDVTAIKAVNEDSGALIMSKGGIWSLSGQARTNYNAFLLSMGVGCVAHETLQINDGVPIWLDECGFYYIESGGSYPKRFTQLDSIFETIDFSRITDAWAIQYRGNYNTGNQYWCGITLGSGLSSNNYLFVFDYTSASWYYYTNIPCDILAKGTDSNGQEILYGSFNDGWIYQLDTGEQDDGNTIPSCFITAPIYGKQELGTAGSTVTKNWNRLEIWYRSKYPATINLMCTADYSGSTFPRGGTEKVITLASESDPPAQYELDALETTTHFLRTKYANRVKVPIDLKGRYIQIRISCNDVAQDWDIYKMVLSYEVSGLN